MFIPTPARALFAPSIDPDAAAWRHAVIAAGGSVSAPQTRRISALIHALKACGAWAPTDDYAVYAAENQTQALVTLKKRQTQTLAHVISTNPTFVANRGFLGNADGYINTGWNPSSNFYYAQNNARFGLWCYLDPGTSSSKREMGNDDDNWGEIQFSTGPAIFLGINQALSINWTPAVRTGLIVAERTGATTMSGYQNGIQKTVGSIASIAVVNRNFYVLAANGSAGAVAPTNSGIAAALIGAALTNAAIYAAENIALRAYMTSMGVP